MSFCFKRAQHFILLFRAADNMAVPMSASSSLKHFSKKTKKGPPRHLKGVTVHKILGELEEDVSLDEAEGKMKKSIEHLRLELANIRAGRATPGMIDHLTVDRPTGAVPIKALGTVTVKDPQNLMVSLFDAEAVDSVVSAIDSSPLKLQSKMMSQHEVLVVLPKQSHETIEALSKLVGKEGEHSKTAVRSARKIGINEVKKLASKDDQKRAEKAVDFLTESYVRQIDEICENKKRELNSG